ncbi:MAG TPA: DUF2098 domain-containing protein [Methanomicrobiales archaeon]|nr:DUF2098 domain-containing protein [Methanomicrobiales archaeon]
MDVGDIAVGMHVRYPRTGTSGRVEKIEKVGEETFAQLDCTHLLYRVDFLVNAEAQEEQKKELKEDLKKRIEEERDFSRMQDVWEHTDQSCEGGG